eukprot:jgi/Botrbrau1/2483/Bobra.0226s0040.1
MGDFCCHGTELGKRWSLESLENGNEEAHDVFSIHMLLKGIRTLSHGAQQSAWSRFNEASANHNGLSVGVDFLFADIIDGSAVYLTLYAVMEGTLDVYNVSVGNLLSTEAHGQGLVKTSRRLLSRVSLQGFNLSTEPTWRVPEVGIHHSRHAFKTAGATKVISVPISASKFEDLEQMSNQERPLGFLTIGWQHLPSHLEARVIKRMQQLADVVAEDFVAAHEQIVMHMGFFLPPAESPPGGGDDNHALDHPHRSPSSDDDSGSRSEALWKYSVQFPTAQCDSETPFTGFLLEDSSQAPDFEILPDDASCRKVECELKRARSSAVRDVSQCDTWLTFKDEAVEGAFLRDQNNQAAVADAVVMVVAILALVPQPWLEAVPKSIEGVGIFCLAGVVCAIWLTAIIARPKRYNTWRETNLVLGNYFFAYTLCRLRFLLLLEAEAAGPGEAYWPAFRHLASQPLVEAGLFVAFKLRVRSAILYRSLPSFLMTTVLNYHLVRDCMPGGNLVFLMIASTLLRIASIYVMAVFHRGLEARDRMNFLHRLHTRSEASVAT